MPDKLTDNLANNSPISSNSLSDTEIKKALEICGTYKGKCTDCPAFVKVDRSNCKKVLLGALDLINRQDFKIHQLEKQVSEIQNANLINFKTTIGNYIAENESLKAEVERLKPLEENLDKLLYMLNAVDMGQSVLEEQKYAIKAEAYKEFAERLIAEYAQGMSWFRSKEVCYVDVQDIRKLLKEMPLNDVKCLDCEYLELELPYAVCSKAYKGIVRPNDSCGKGKLKELVGEDNSTNIDKQK